MQIDNLQPKFAAYNGATVQGSVPLSGDTVLIGEFAPGNGVFTLIDRALKASAVEATTQLVEREFGFFILRSPSNAEVSAAPRRNSVGAWRIHERPGQTKRRLDPDHHLRRTLSGAIVEQVAQGVAPGAGPDARHRRMCTGGYISIAANEAEKSADIDIVEVRAVGRFGRLFISGSEDSVQTAMDAATTAIGSIDGRDG